MKKSTKRNKVVSTIKSIFLSGFFTILPLTLTIALLNISFKLIKSWLAPIYIHEPAYLKFIPHSEIFLVLLFIFAVGIVLKFLLLQPIIHAVESIFSRIPLWRQVYFGIKQLVHAFSSQDKLSFQHVVFIEFPRPGSYSLGFLTGSLPPELAPIPDKKFYSIFIPTTPNPTTGFYVVVVESECIIVDLTRQEAMAIIISGGIIQPDRFKN